jgi:hypothetical protein
VLSSLGSAVLKLSCGAAEAARLRSLVGPGQRATGVFIGMSEFGDTEWINRALLCGMLRPTLLAPNPGQGRATLGPVWACVRARHPPMVRFVVRVVSRKGLQDNTPS